MTRLFHHIVCSHRTSQRTHEGFNGLSSTRQGLQQTVNERRIDFLWRSAFLYMSVGAFSQLIRNYIDVVKLARTLPGPESMRGDELEASPQHPTSGAPRTSEIEC